jgi:hypothetical protein
MIAAAWTSQTCPGCGYRNIDGIEQRTKTCTRNLVCALHPGDQPYSEYDRDQLAKTTIALRGVYCIAGKQEYGQWTPRGW